MKWYELLGYGCQYSARYAKPSAGITAPCMLDDLTGSRSAYCQSEKRKHIKRVLGVAVLLVL